MEIFLISLQIIAWEDFFGDLRHKTYRNVHVSKKEECIDFPSSSTCYVVDCLFENINEAGSSGAVWASQCEEFMIETSTFSNVTSDSWSASGGIIYYKDSGDCVLNKICSYKAISKKSNGHFARIVTPTNYETITHPNLVIDSSISYSGFAEDTSINGALYQEKGRIMLERDNFSQNIANTNAAFSCKPTRDEVKGDTRYAVLYSSISNNTANSDSIFEINFANKAYKVESCNLIYNKSPQNLIILTGEISINGCCILENEAVKMFNIVDELTQLTISNTTIDRHDSNLPITFNEYVGDAFINKLEFSKSQSCDAKLDSVGTLFPAAEVEAKTKKYRSNGLDTIRFLILVSLIISKE